MKLQVFNGGLNIRQAAELTNPAEARVCHNAEISTGNIAPVNDLGATVITSLAKPFYFISNSEWMANADVNDYLEYQSKLYWTNSGLAQKYNGTTISNLGIAAPTVAPVVTVGAAGVLTGTYQYVYTYYNVADGTESAPSPISLEVAPTAQQVTASVVASTDPQVSHIWIYRIGTSILDLTKVVELSNTTAVYADNIATASLPGPILTSTTNNAPPSGLRYLVESGGIFFGALGAKLYYSRDIGDPNYWPATQTINFDEDITGLAVSSMGLLVFTRFETYVITGYSTATFTKLLLDGTQGCINSRTIRQYKGAVFFVSTDGICVLQGSLVRVISRPKLGKQLYSPVNAVVFDEVYYLQLVDKSLVVFDPRYGPVFKTLDMVTEWLSLANDKLYAEKAGSSYEMFQGAPLTFSYTTGDYTEGSLSNLKQYDNLYFYLTGSITVDVKINGTSVANKTLTGTAKPIQLMIPQQLQAGSAISFSFSGTGTLKELEYKAVPRQNGR